MPLYEYQCDCGATLEILESVGATRRVCGEACTKKNGDPQCGLGALERQFSSSQIRGDGHAATEPSFDPCRRSGRPVGCD